MSTIKKIKLDNTTYDIGVDWGNIESKPGEIPTKTSDLINDSGFLTQHQDISGKEDIENKINTITDDSSAITYYDDQGQQHTKDITVIYPTYSAVKEYVNYKKDTILDYVDESCENIPTKTSDLTNDSGFLTQHQDISDKEDVSNKVNVVSNSSTDNQYPSAKCLYDRTHWVNVDNIDNAINQDCFYVYTTGTSYNKQIYFLICVGDNVEDLGGVRTQYRCNATPGSWERTIQYRSQRYSASKNGWINDKDEVGAWTDWDEFGSESMNIDSMSQEEINQLFSSSSN